MPFDPDITTNKLIRLRQQMGASLGRYTPGRRENRSAQAQIVMGLGEITPVVLNRDMFEEEVFTIGGLLTHLGVHKTLHIYDPFVSREHLEATPALNPKFHLADCVTLETMRSQNRYDRYVVSQQTDGLFPVRAYDHLTDRRDQDEILSRIQPCKNCLRQLDYEGFDSASHHERRRIFEQFDLMEFFATYETMFRTLPRLTRHTMGEGQYTADWALDYQQGCGVQRIGSALSARSIVLMTETCFMYTTEMEIVETIKETICRFCASTATAGSQHTLG